jgi:proline dehydrogenase
MLEAISKSVFHALAGSAALKRLASRYGMAGGRAFARRFIAGERIEDAIAAARAIEGRGLTHTLDYLGESVTSAAAAAAAADQYVHIIERVAAAGIGRNLSLKLTQLGLDLGDEIASANLRRILEPAARSEFFVRIDMENSPYTDRTLAIFERLWGEGFRNVGVVLQSALHRSEGDLQRMIALGARVRLVKGAYKEAAGIAWQRKSEVDAAYVRMMDVLLREGQYPALATHDPDIIRLARERAAQLGIQRTGFEFQMLYGIRRDLQAALSAGGYGVRVYIPFGREWFPYFMRRLGERPANVGFVLRSLLSER